MFRQRALFLDRDGVINVDKHYVGTVDRFEFISGALSFLKKAKECGFRLAVVTNQSGVARGMFTQDDYINLTNHMLSEARAYGAEIDLVLVCFNHEEGSVPEYSKPSFWRKPNPGMMLEAAKIIRADMARSVSIGDNARDAMAGISAGIAKNLLISPNASLMLDGAISVSSYEDALREMCL